MRQGSGTEGEEGTTKVGRAGDGRRSDGGRAKRAQRGDGKAGEGAQRSMREAMSACWVAREAVTGARCVQCKLCSSQRATRENATPVLCRPSLALRPTNGFLLPTMFSTLDGRRR